MATKLSIAQVRATNNAATWSYLPTGVFFGATSGIGEGIERAFAEAAKDHAQIIIAARSRTRGEAILASLPQTSDSKYDFVQCDASDLKNIATAAKEVNEKLPDGKLNYLVLCESVYDWGPPQPSLNGLDLRMVLDFYSRWKVVDELIPLLEKAAAMGEDARVLNIKGGNGNLRLDLNDLGFRKNSSSVAQTKATTLYNNIMVEEYSKHHSTVSFCHIFPGMVNTPGWNVAPLWTKPLLAAGKLFMVSPEESGQRMLAALLRPEYKTGGFCLDNYGKEVEAQKETHEVRRLLAEHYRKEVAT